MNKCLRCTFYVSEANGKGECQRFPPQMDSSTSEVISLGVSRPVFRYPTVDSELDFCGEFKNKNRG